MKNKIHPIKSSVNQLRSAILGATALCLSAVGVWAQPEPVLLTNLYTFQGSPDGRYPLWLKYGDGGVLFGVTYSGGANNVGAIFKINRDGTGETVLHSFTSNDGGSTTTAYLVGQPKNLTVLQGNDGALYGTTSGGGDGYGTVFKLFPDGAGYTILHNFTNNDETPLGLIQGKDGALYGVSTGGGITVFKLNTDGTGYTVLHSSSEGHDSFGLTQGNDDALYGTTYYGAGISSGGILFKLNTDGSGFAVLHTFGSGTTNGVTPFAIPMQSTDGALYGTTRQGGANNLGTVYKINADGSNFQVLYSFGGNPDGANPLGNLVQGPDNMLYGTTYSGGTNNVGTIFKIGSDGSGYLVLNNLPGNGISYNPLAGLVAGPASDGSAAFYGTTEDSVGATPEGAVFALLINPPPTITPIAGTIGGQTAVCWPSWALGYRLQVTTNLASTNWVTVSNAVPLTGALVTNNLPAAYYRLVWP